MGELYKLTFANGKSYIGIAAKTANSRFICHRWSSKTSESLLYRAWRKYGEPNLTVLAIMENAVLQEIEVKAIAVYGTFAPGGYNRTIGGEGVRGLKHSPEALAKMSAIHLGSKRTPETKAKISAASLRMPAEARARTNAALRTQEARERSRVLRAGKPLTPEHREKVRLALQYQSPETKAKKKAAALRRTPEHYAKVAEKLRHRSPEVLARLSASIKKSWIKRKANASNPSQLPLTQLEDCQ